MTVAIPSKDEEDDLVSMAADSNPRSKGKQSVASKRGVDDMETNSDNDNGNTRQSQCSCLTSEDNKDEQGVYYMECSRC